MSYSTVTICCVAVVICELMCCVFCVLLTNTHWQKDTNIQ